MISNPISTNQTICWEMQNSDQYGRQDDHNYNNWIPSLQTRLGQWKLDLIKQNFYDCADKALTDDRQLLSLKF